MTFVTWDVSEKKRRKFWRRMGEQKKGVVLQVQQTFLRLAGSSISTRIYILFFFDRWKSAIVSSTMWIMGNNYEYLCIYDLTTLRLEMLLLAARHPADCVEKMILKTYSQGLSRSDVMEYLLNTFPLLDRSTIRERVSRQARSYKKNI